MSIKNNTTSLQSLLDAVNALPEAGGVVELPELTNEGTAADLSAGKQLIDGEGNIVVGTAKELPNAEESPFGRTTGNEEYGITITDASKIGRYNYSGDVKVYQEYAVKEAFSLVGVRVYSVTASNNSRDLEISINGELKTTATIAYKTAVVGWNMLYFDSPIKVAVGDVIKIYEQYEEMPRNISLSYATVNPKVEIKNGFAGGFSGTTAVYGIFDVIIGPVEAELPDTYQIERTTLDDMAVELQRITNVDTKINIEQMQSGLESVVLQEKSVTPTVETQIVTPDSDYYGLSKVTVNPAQLQEKTVAPTTEQQEITPDSGYYGLSKVVVEPSIGGSSEMFNTMASGILPEIAKGTAMGDFTFNFEISATGALQEE